MAYSHPTRAAIAASSSDMLTLVDDLSEQAGHRDGHAGTGHNRHLDRSQLLTGLAARQQQLAEVEAELVAACERAAARGADRGIHIDDRATWDRAMWQRYIDAAGRLEPEYGPRLRHLYRQVDRLGRLAALPLAA